MKTLFALVVLCFVAAAASAQSLGEIAKREEERRKTVAAPSKVYTNDSLGREPASSTPAPAPAAAAQAPASAPAPPSGSRAQAQPGETPAAVPAEPDPTKTEAYWRQRIAAARDGLARSQTFAEALQTRINTLSADFVNRDDPAQRSVLSADRQKTVAELERVKAEIQQYQKAIVDTEEEARRNSIPPGWLR